MNCPKCGHESKGKFCGKCGTELPPLPQAIQSPDPTAKFIDPLTAGAFGTAIGAVAGAAIGAVVSRPKPEENKGSKVEGVTELEKCCIKLDLSPGVIARKVSEKEMEAYASREGVIVSPGALLIVIADGVIVSKLSGGRYALPMDRGKHVAHLGKEATGSLVDRLINWFRKQDNVAEEKAITHEEAERIRKAKHVSLVLVREGDFVLPFGFKNLPFAEGVTSDVGVTLLLKVNDAEALLKHSMVDVPVADDLRKILEPRLQMELSRILPSYRMENFVPGPEILDGLPPALREAMDSTYPGIVILRVITASTTGEALKSIREAANELYLNRLKLGQNEELLAARNIARSQSNRKLLDDAKNDAEMAAAVRAIADEARRSGLLSDENIEVFQREMVERFKDRNIESLSKDMKRSQVIELLDIDLQLEKDKAEIKSRILRNDDKQELLKQELGQDHELTKQSLEQQLQQNRLKYELDFGIAHAEIAVERARDAYGDERAERGLDFDARKSRLDTDLHHDKKKKQLERLAELQAIREQRGEAAHQREMAAKQQADATKLQEMDRFKDMSFEQIMAMKQDLSGEAGARALEARFGVDHARELVAKEREMAEREQAISAQHQEKSSESKEAELKRMEAMMDRMQQMAEATVKQTAAIASGQVAQAKSTREDVVSAMESTLKASGQVFSADARAKGPKQPQQNAGKPAKVRYCKSCEAELDSDSTFCPECGEKVE